MSSSTTPERVTRPQAADQAHDYETRSLSDASGDPWKTLANWITEPGDPRTRLVLLAVASAGPTATLLRVGPDRNVDTAPAVASRRGCVDLRVGAAAGPQQGGRVEAVAARAVTARGVVRRSVRSRSFDAAREIGHPSRGRREPRARRSGASRRRTRIEPPATRVGIDIDHVLVVVFGVQARLGRCTALVPTRGRQVV